MNLPTHIPGQFSGQLPNQPGTSIPALPHQQILMQGQRSTLNMEPGFVKARRFIQERIYDFLMQRQQTQEIPQKKVLDIVKRLEEGLFKTATSKEEYMNMETLERRLHHLIKRLPLNNQNQQFQQQRNHTSVSMGTMIPTPGMSQPDNSMVPPVSSGSFLSEGGNNSMISSMGAQRMASQMIPTPGFSSSNDNNNNRNNNGNTTTTSNQSYINMDSSNNVGISSVGPTMVTQQLQQRQQRFQNGSMKNLGMVSGYGGTNDSLGSGSFYGGTSTPSGNMNPVSLQALHKTSSPMMINQANLRNNQQIGNVKPLVDQSTKMDFHYQQSLQFQQQNQRLMSDSGVQIKSEPGMESHVEGLQQFGVDSNNDLGGQLEGIHGHWNVQEEFNQRITGQDEAQRNNLSSEESANKTVNQLTTGQNPNLNRESHYKNQQRWLLFLTHARKCVHPPGKCAESNCITAQNLWNHMASCKDVVQCQFPRCRGTKHLIRHYRTCQESNCPVCVPVKNFLQRKGGIRTNSNSNSDLPHECEPPGVHVMKTSPSVVETSEDLQPPMKRMKIEPPLRTEIENSVIQMIPVSNTLEVPIKSETEPTSICLPCFPKIEAKKDCIEDAGIQKSESVPISSKEEVISVKSELPETSAVTKSGKPKIKGVSMIELFTPEQIREHIAGLRQWVGQSKAKVEKNQAMESLMNENSCQLCAVEKLSFEPPPIYCTPCGARIKRNAMFYTIGTGDTRHFFCIPCFNETRGDSINVDGRNIPKARMEKKKNDEDTEEWWVQCDKCEAWQHQICALFNGKRNDGGQAEYTCPNCYMEEVERGERVPLPQSSVLGAKDLPRTILSDHIENRLFKRLKQERMERARYYGKSYDEVPGAESLVVRVVSSVDKKLEVKPRFLEIFQEENYPKEFGYKSKVVLLFQKIEGVEVCLFGMYVQEFGTECQQPNNRRVYLSYLDSVKYFRPEIRTVTGEALRTFVYHEILIGYLEYCKLRGFTSCYIWACPPLKGEDYILYCHPEIQKTPKSDKLREWYLAMLKKATKENIVSELTNLYDHFFLSSGECKAKITAARLPYFDGDYWPGAAEDMIYQLRQEEGKKLNKKGPIKKTVTKRALKASSQVDLPGNASKDLQLMHKLGESIAPMKEDFIMVHLQPACTHCCNLMVSGKRWVCRQCKNFRLCDRCHEIEQNLDERERHPINHREKHPLYPIDIIDIPTDTKDKDEILESEFFDTRQAFLSLCQGNHYQYDTLRRAKHSSMMVLYHLHNPTAPAFVTSCNKCHLDIESGQGWRCEVCPDFDVCNSCYYKNGGINHPHKLTNHPSSSESNAQNKEARQQRVLQLRKMLDLLVHASQCRSAICQYPNCRKVKGLFRHGINCKTRASGGCVLCKKMWYLLQLHARACKEPQCHVPRCRDLNEHLRRLQQQSDSRRRAAVMEMMRQRAAEVAGSS